MVSNRTDSPSSEPDLESEGLARRACSWETIDSRRIGCRPEEARRDSSSSQTTYYTRTMIQQMLAPSKERIQTMEDSTPYSSILPRALFHPLSEEWDQADTALLPLPTNHAARCRETAGSASRTPLATSPSSSRSSS